MDCCTPVNTPSSLKEPEGPQAVWDKLTDRQRDILAGMHAYHEFLLEEGYMEADGLKGDEPEHNFLQIHGDPKEMIILLQNLDVQAVLERLIQDCDSRKQRRLHRRRVDTDHQVPLSPLTSQSPLVVDEEEPSPKRIKSCD
jgi:hypothetical protein